MSYAEHEGSRYSGQPVDLFLIQGGGGNLGPYGFNNSESNIVRSGVTYYPWPIKHSDIDDSGSLDKSDMTVSMALGSPIDELFLAYPPSQTVNLTIFEGHMDDTVSSGTYPAVWIGRVLGASLRDNELDLSCQPVSSVIQRPGLRRPYQIGCPHVLYGPQCQASKADASYTRHLGSFHSGNRIELTTDMGATPSSFVGGLLEWTNEDNGRKEIRTITAVSSDGLTLTIRGQLRGIDSGTSLSVIRGCNRQMSGCIQHANILNYGGQPFIPSENPLSSKNQFY